MQRNTNISEQDFLQADHDAMMAAEEYKGCLYPKLIFEAKCKDRLALIKTEIKAGAPGKKFSEVELERLARASNDWLKFRAGEMQAFLESEKARIVYEVKKQTWDTYRSCRSVHKTEVQRFRG